MKFTVAVALLASSVSAFTFPIVSSCSSSTTTRPSNGLTMSAVETEVYTFAKSEEIFAEAQTVS
jgi:hypothetical protein